MRVWDEIGSAGERGWPQWVGFVGWAALLALGLATVLSLPIEVILRDLSSDDSFYYYQIAWVFAETGRSSFDGSQLTNGYHPLWMLLLSGMSLFFEDKTTFLYASKVLEILLVFGGLVFAWRAFVRIPGAWAALPLLLLWVVKNKILYEGLETAVWFCMTMASFWAARSLWEHPEKKGRAWILGSALALVGLARLEAFLYGFLVPGMLLLVPTASHASMQVRKRAVLRSCLLLMGAVAVYLLSNRVFFGTWTPISGQVKTWWSFGARGGNQDFSGFLKQLQELLGSSAVREGLWLGLVALTGFFVLRRWRPSSVSVMAMGLIVCLGLLHLARVLWFAWSTRVPFADYSHYYVTGRWLRYLLLFLALSSLAGFLQHRKGFRAALVLCLLIWVGTGIAAWKSVTKRSRAFASEQVDWEILSYREAKNMAGLLPKDARVGSFDAGVTGYFAPMPVYALDGLVGSRALFEATQAGKLEDFLEEQKIRYLVNLVSVETRDLASWWNVRSSQGPLRGQLETVYRSPARAQAPEGWLDYRILRYTPPR